MKTQFTSNQYNVTENNLSNAFDGFIDGVETLNLWHIEILPSGHGHYSIEATFNVNEKELVVKTTTSNMPLIDAWKSGDMYEAGEDGFENWDEVAETMLSTIDAEDYITEFIF